MICGAIGTGGGSLAAMASSATPLAGVLAPIAAFVLVSVFWFVLVVLWRRSRDESVEAVRRLESELTPSDPGVQDLLASRPTPAPRRTSNATAVPLIAAMAGLGWWVSVRPVVGIVVFVAGLVVLNSVRNAQRRREERFEADSALAALGVAARALRAGIPLAGVLEILGREARGRAGDAFREIIHRETLGEPLTRSIREVLLASERPELRAFGLAMIVQTSSGGDLATTTDRLVRSLVDRDFVRRRVRSILLYARGATSLLAFFPILMFLMMGSVVDGYLDFVLDRPVGNMLLLISATLVFVGLVTVQRIGRIEPTGQGVSA